jgi:hypothetical protein
VGRNLVLDSRVFFLVIEIVPVVVRGHKSRAIEHWFESVRLAYRVLGIAQEGAAMKKFLAWRGQHQQIF